MDLGQQHPLAKVLPLAFERMYSVPNASEMWLAFGSGTGRITARAITPESAIRLLGTNQEHKPRFLVWSVPRGLDLRGPGRLAMVTAAYAARRGVPLVLPDVPKMGTGVGRKPRSGGRSGRQVDRPGSRKPSPATSAQVRFPSIGLFTRAGSLGAVASDRTTLSCPARLGCSVSGFFPKQPFKATVTSNHDPLSNTRSWLSG